MKIKIQDLRLIIETVPAGTDVIELETFDRMGVKGLEVAYGHTAGKIVRIAVYDAGLGVTPDLTQTTKLYRKT
jgi:hypothetical protein